MTRSRPTVHLIYGYIAAGKTTLAKALERELPAVRYSPDEFMVTLFGEDPREDDFRKYQPRIYEMASAHWPQVIRCGVDVVLDYAFWPRWHRDAARAVATEAGADTKLYFVRCADDVALARALARNESLGGSLYINENTFAVLRDRFEPLGLDEPHEVVET